MKVKTKDEIGEMANALNISIQGLNKKAEFARKKSHLIKLEEDRELRDGQLLSNGNLLLMFGLKESDSDKRFVKIFNPKTRKYIQLEEQVEEVNRTQKRTQLLLENASEVITIYEEDGTIRYISPSVEPIFGYNQNELIDTKDIDYVLSEYVDTVNGMFKQLLDNPYEQVTIQYEYKTKSGTPIWIESRGTNFMSNPAIHGLIVNSTDITERRRAELPPAS